MNELNFSARADDLFLKVARPLADLGGTSRSNLRIYWSPFSIEVLIARYGRRVFFAEHLGKHRLYRVATSGALKRIFTLARRRA
ncbi:MAG: hypothetical protein ACI9R3_004619 [Verrucomicrobiales bacterium]|jgi:hypothetical protein